MRNVSYERARENEYVAATNDQIIRDSLACDGWLDGILRRLGGYPDPDGCWTWDRSTKHGYGQVMSPGRHGERASLAVHRVIWIALCGPIEAGLVLDHDGPSGCHNRACANPAHLRAVTQRVNLAARACETTEVCARGHRLIVSGYGKRRCRDCAMEKNQLIREAAKTLGMGFCEYTRTHGWARETAEHVLARRAAA